MTKYSDADLGGEWEFKIVRANPRRPSKSAEVLRQVCDARRPERAGRWRRSSTTCACALNAPSGPAHCAGDANLGNRHLPHPVRCVARGLSRREDGLLAILLSMVVMFAFIAFVVKR